MWRRLGVGVLVSLMLGCSAKPKPGFDPVGSSGSSSGFGSSGGFDIDGGKPSVDGCSDAARLVYVVSQENDLYSFTPNTTTFQLIGRLECPTNGLATPNSMAIDRQGIAWVNYSDGSLFKVSTADASCSATTFAPNQHGFLRFGMAFATNSENSTDETLYISGLELSGSNGKGLGKIDLQTMKITMLGDYSGDLTGKGAELTGTGDGHLFGFFTTQPNATLAEIDRANGSTSNDKSLDGVNTGNAWAFSFWGGDFWFYTSDGVNPSRVTRLETSASGAISVAKSDVGGFRIVGAGVSTCAPTAPPK
ncbi:MAG: hypothetical protein BGO98_28305 [Myxococcales bacterium 68-20]|nr:MAG: hypothetical protein BGO98_28305 [Myxococcales bacterium 68-20]